MAKQEYKVLKTFDSAFGVKKAGSIVTFSNEKVAREFKNRGLVIEKNKPGRKPKQQSEKVKTKQPGQ